MNFENHFLNDNEKFDNLSSDTVDGNNINSRIIELDNLDKFILKSIEEKSEFN